MRSIDTFKHFSQYFVLRAAGRSFMGFIAAHKKSDKIESEIFEGEGALNTPHTLY